MFKKERLCTLTKKMIDHKASEKLKQMTLKEKVWMLNGNWDIIGNLIKYKNAYNPTPISTNGCKRLGVSPVKFTDGPRGIVMGHSTCFPVSMARGASFDRELEERIGHVIGKEARAGGANYFAGVCINLLRHPAWGRAQETYSEDPYHLGEMGKALTEGVQEHNVMVCLKHYAVNNIENSRFKVNVTSSERVLREIYLPHFKKSVEAGAASLMGSYNLYRGDQCCESTHLLTTILREEWGFEGFTCSDFIFGIHDGVKAVKAGLDIEMPMPIKYQRHLLKAVKEGRVPESVIDKSVLRVLKTLLVFENIPDKREYKTDLIACKDHTVLAREAAEKSMVLIKNENGVLPFKKSIKSVLVVGKLAVKPNTGDHGSSRIYAPYVVTPMEGLKRYLGENVEIIHCDESEADRAGKYAALVDCVIIIVGNDYNDEGENVNSGQDENDFSLIQQGLKNQGNHIQAFLMKMKTGQLKKSYTSHDGKAAGGDRSSLSLKPEEIDIIRKTGRINPHTVVTLIGGSMIMTREWDSVVPSILYSWYSGMEGGNALARILFGDVNPSGKLPFTIPSDKDHLPYFSSTDTEIEYGLYHGYTLLEKQGNKPSYPFGFGLSYTNWKYENMTVEKDYDKINVSLSLINTGEMDGEEVVQVYVGMIDSQVDRQEKLLKGFEKVFVKGGEKKSVTIPVELNELRYYEEERGEWILEKGTYRIYAGPSSDDRMLLKRELTL